MTLPKPTNCTQEVLLTLLKSGKVSIMDFPYLSGFRTRISDLRLKYNLSLETESKTGRNKFNRIFTYAEHSLPETEKEKAKQIYLTLKNER